MLISENEYIAYRLFCYEYIRKNCVIFGKFPARNPKKKLTRMFYLKRGLYNTNFLIPATKALIYLIEKKISHFNFQISGLETGSTPLLISLPMVLKQDYGITINSFSVRKDKKNYGLLNRTEGLTNDKPILLIDDIYNSGNSTKQCIEFLKQENISNIIDMYISILCSKPKNENIYLFQWDIFTKEVCEKP